MIEICVYVSGMIPPEGDRLPPILAQDQNAMGANIFCPGWRINKYSLFRNNLISSESPSPALGEGFRMRAMG